MLYIFCTQCFMVWRKNVSTVYVLHAYYLCCGHKKEFYSHIFRHPFHINKHHGIQWEQVGYMCASKTRASHQNQSQSPDRSALTFNRNWSHTHPGMSSSTFSVMFMGRGTFFSSKTISFFFSNLRLVGLHIKQLPKCKPSAHWHSQIPALLQLVLLAPL